MSGEMRVRVFEEHEGVSQCRESLQLGGDAIDVSTGEEQEPSRHRDAESEEEHRHHEHRQACLATSGGDRQRDAQAHHVRRVIRRDVDHHARGHDRTRHGSPLECLGHHDGAADPCRRKRLIDEQLRETELVGRRQWQAVTGGARHTAKDLALRQVRCALQAHRQHEPPRLGSLRDATNSRPSET